MRAGGQLKCGQRMPEKGLNRLQTGAYGKASSGYRAGHARVIGSEATGGIMLGALGKVVARQWPREQVATRRENAASMRDGEFRLGQEQAEAFAQRALFLRQIRDGVAFEH